MDNDDARSLRRIVLQLLHEDEDEARRELDDIIRTVAENIGRESSLYTWAVPVLLTIPPLLMTAFLIARPFSKTAGNILFGAAQVSCLIPLYALWKWGRFQYGRGWLWTPREALYLNASDETKETLEKFFAYIQREGGPKAYFRDRKGKKHYLDRRYSFGKLRVLLLSEFGAFRSLCLLPGGKRVSEAIKIEADPSEIINALKIKPKRGSGPGRNVKYAYIEAIFDLRSDPRLETLDLKDEATAIHAITDWLDEWFDSSANVSGEIPKRDRLVPYAKKIYAHLKNSVAPNDR
ncbi:hypothetical protein SAMIE_1018590 [Sphingobium amiense]|uniref:DUF3137 domain-containing protein n=2 Tax=Sphingobium amiense TaxID=135719 RepID=A0A494W5C0_9SPHN|nr:hypothetical protein [Sphingobium amiense]BBD98358.1 hypothetical protein SAMIE_1018590 [Sphingobium amiense]